MKKLNLCKIQFIPRHSRGGELSPRQIWKRMKIDKTTYYRILKRYEDVEDRTSITAQNRKEKKQGRKLKPVPYEHIHKIMECRNIFQVNANRICELLKRNENISLSHHIIYKVLKNASMIDVQKNKKKKRNSWVRFEHKHSLSLWQTDWTRLKGKWLIVFLDDASRLVVGWGFI